MSSSNYLKNKKKCLKQINDIEDKIKIELEKVKLLLLLLNCESLDNIKPLLIKNFETIKLLEDEVTLYLDFYKVK